VLEGARSICARREHSADDPNWHRLAVV
jgi:hypothetical protein